MELSREEVIKIARLAQLELSEDEIEQFRSKLAKVVGYVKELEGLSLDSSGSPQHVPKDSVSFREDRAITFEKREALLSNGPSTRDDTFVIPPVMGENQ